MSSSSAVWWPTPTTCLCAASGDPTRAIRHGSAADETHSSRSILSLAEQNLTLQSLPTADEPNLDTFRLTTFSAQVSRP